MRASARDSADCGGPGPGDWATSLEDRATTTPLAMPSTIAPETRIMTPYMAVNRRRTVRRGNTERRGRCADTFVIASRGRYPRPSPIQDARSDLTAK